MSELEATLRRVITHLQGQHAKFAVVGGLAVSARSEPRFTRHADLCVAVEEDAEAEAVVHGLLALKVPARNDRTRPQDRLDALALLAIATSEERETTRALLATIEHRGFARERDLSEAFDTLIEEASG